MKIFAKALALILSFYSVTAYAGIPDWSVSELNGTVTVVRAQGATVAASRGTVLRPGDTIFTGLKSRAVIVRKQEYVILAQNSRIVAAPPKAGSIVQIVQAGGNAIYKIKKKTAPHFSVQTPYLAAVVKGTTFSVTVTTSGASVQVMEGRVQVIANEGEAEHLLIPGKIGIVDVKLPNRLTVKGDGADIVIDGTIAPTGMAPTTLQVAVNVANVVVARSEISADITEGEMRLEKLTDGLITGDSSLSAVTKLALLEGPDSRSNNGSGSSSPPAGESASGNVSANPQGKDDGKGDDKSIIGGKDDAGDKSSDVKDDDDDKGDKAPGGKDDGDKGDKVLGGKDDGDKGSGGKEDGDKGDKGLGGKDDGDKGNKGSGGKDDGDKGGKGGD